MPYSVWEAYIADEKGKILGGAEVEVIDENTGAKATIYSDPAGSSKSNPFNATQEGKARFYAPGNVKGYRIDATSGNATATYRHQQVGEAQGHDVGDDADDKLLTREQLDGRYYRKVKDNPSGNGAPGPNDDENAGYDQGSRWYDETVSPNEVYVCLDPSAGAAKWAKTTLTLDELGSMATKNEGSAADEFSDNATLDATYYPLASAMKEISGTSYTLQASDNGKILYTTNASDVTITVPTGLHPIQTAVWRYGDGAVTLAEGSGCTINSPEGYNTIETKFAMGTVVSKASDEYGFFGGLEPLEPSDIGAAYALSGYGSPSGTVSRAAWTIYTAPTISSPPTQSEVQALANHLETLSQHVGAMQKDLD